ncbi:O-antigen ligase family protein [Acinetobacter brisouii]
MNFLKINKDSLSSNLLCLWLTLFNLIILLNIENQIIQQAVFLLCIFIYFFQFGFNVFRLNAYNLLVILFLSLSIMLSLLANFGNPIVFFALINFVIFSFFLSTYSSFRPEVFRDGLKKYSLTNSVILLILATKSGFNMDSRSLVEGVQPNYIGLICLTSALSAILFDRVLIRYFLIFFTLFISYLVSSRTSMLCISLIFVFLIFLKIKDNKKYIIPFIGFFVLLISLSYEKIIFLISSAFMLNDDYRGVGTGLSGRSDRWDIAFSVIEKNPIFGVGFKMGESTLGFTTDNGYISVLLELGVWGFIVFIVMICVVNFLSLQNLFKKNIVDNHFSSIAIFILTIYIFFEQRYINFGNSLTFILFFCIFNILSFKNLKRTKIGTL